MTRLLASRSTQELGAGLQQCSPGFWGNLCEGAPLIPVGALNTDLQGGHGRCEQRRRHQGAQRRAGEEAAHRLLE